MTRFVHRGRLTLVGLVSVVSVALVATGCGSDSKSSGNLSSSAPAGAKFDQAAHDLLPARIKTSGVIRFAGPSNPPALIANGSDITGLVVDLGSALGVVLGVQVTQAAIADAATARTGILADRYDVFGGPSVLTADRHKQFDGVAYQAVGTAMVLKATNTTVRTADDLCGLRVAVQANGLNATQATAQSKACVAAGKQPITQVALDDPVTSNLAVLSDRVDVALETDNVAEPAVKSNSALRFVAGAGDILGSKNTGGVLCLPDLSPALLAAFKVLYADGEYKRIMQKWNQDSGEIPEPLLNFLQG